jgi:hypothetical protein
MMSKLQIILFTLILVATSVCLIFMLAGCTTLSHEPECTCDCKENNSHFECGGIIHHEEIEIK